MLRYDLYQNGLRFLSLVHPEWNVKLSFQHVLKSKVNLKNPKTFNEKICWLKLYDYPNNALVIRCADKVKVRDYVREKGLGDLLNEVYQVCDTPDEINFDTLPDEYVVKLNNDCGSTLICHKGTDIEKIKAKLNSLKRRKYFLDTAELHYSKIKPKIIVEKLLKGDNQAGVCDYKVYCFNGIPYYVMVCLDRQQGHTRFYYYDKQWNFLRVNIDGRQAPKDFNIPKPVYLDQMLKVAHTLSEDFKFVRTDFYIANNKLVFGELTFSPSAGMDEDIDGELDPLLSKHLVL
ncbi:ATP-grasp fold amidoligase family protein [Liquorilactobacillus satsumensis]|uniref:ATP-grasp fold amidoligase family protein n=1 Tax=Liquorilactobacillus satsumensis TaxID=259059 RepID=UPI001E62BC1D|nr:ATP-grasp fold amidoligase family protein [Liquorilactobacillus satsumensis]MCC7667116.1 glycosyl transferase [Liquorilactobacillus satsumensis]